MAAWSSSTGLGMIRRTLPSSVGRAAIRYVVATPAGFVPTHRRELALLFVRTWRSRRIRDLATNSICGFR
jgi:hypothetical protein